MLSIKLILILLAVGLSLALFYLLGRRPPRLNPVPADAQDTMQEHSSDWLASTFAPESQRELDYNDIGLIPSDQSIGADLAAALDEAEEEIRAADATASQEKVSSAAADEQDVVLLKPRSNSSNIPINSAYRNEVSISDAVLVENAKQEWATQGLFQDDDVDPPSAEQTPPIDKQATSVTARTLLESNSSQLELLEHFTELVRSSDTLHRQISQTKSSHLGDKRVRSEIDSEQKRKWKEADSHAAKQNSKLTEEHQGRRKAEQVIDRQYSEIAQLNKQLEAKKEELQRAKSIASSAAKLARNAVNSERQAKHQAERELKLREKTEARTRKAMEIAKNAITALALEEKKNRFYGG